MTPTERVQGPLMLWMARQKLRGHEPTAGGDAAEIAARQAELIARLTSTTTGGYQIQAKEVAPYAGRHRAG